MNLGRLLSRPIGNFSVVSNASDIAVDLYAKVRREWAPLEQT